MQKILRITAMLLIALLLMPHISFAASDTITLYINDNKINCDVPPQISNGRTLVPVRVIFEHFDAKVYWNDTVKQVTIATENKTIILTINSNTAVVNSKRYVLDTAPVIKDSRTLVPVRFISEALGYDVEWEEKTRSVKISEKTTDTDVSQKDEDKTSDYTISNISVVNSDTEDTVTVKTDCQTAPYMMILADPYRIVLDFESTLLKNGDGKISVNSGYIKEIRYAQHDLSSRVVIECKGTQPYDATFKKGIVTVTVGDEDSYIKDEEQNEPEKDINNSGNTSEGQDNTELEGTESGEETEPQETERDPLAALKFLAGRDENNLLVVLDAGHGGSDPGALGCDVDGNIIIKEKDINLTIANKVAKLLKAKGINFKQTRSTDKYLELKEISDFANSLNADLFVSVHSNAVEDPTVSGTMVLYNGNGNADYGIDGKTIATLIKKEIINNINIVDRGIVSRPGLWVLRKTAMPAALVECAFVTSETDRKLLMDDGILDLFAEAIADGIEESLKIMKENIIKAREELTLAQKNIN